MASKDSTGGATPSKGEAEWAMSGVGGVRSSDDPVPDHWFGEPTEERRDATCSAEWKRDEGLVTALWATSAIKVRDSQTQAGTNGFGPRERNSEVSVKPGPISKRKTKPSPSRTDIEPSAVFEQNFEFVSATAGLAS